MEKKAAKNIISNLNKSSLFERKECLNQKKICKLLSSHSSKWHKCANKFFSSTNLLNLCQRTKSKRVYCQEKMRKFAAKTNIHYNRCRILFEQKQKKNLFLWFKKTFKIFQLQRKPQIQIYILFNANVSS